MEGQSTTLNCSVSGTPRPVIVWKYGSPLQPVKGSRFVVDKTGNLAIKVLHPKNVYYKSGSENISIFANDTLVNHSLAKTI